MDRNELIRSLTKAQKENARLRGVLARLVKAITKVDHPTMTTDRKAYAELVEAHFQGQLVEVTGERAPSGGWPTSTPVVISPTVDGTSAHSA